MCSMENVGIRKLDPADADEVSKIYAAITQKEVKADFKKMIIEQAQKEADACFVAEIEGKVVGYMISYILTGSFGITESAWIPMLGVHPNHMGQGIGKAMAEEVFRFYKAKGIKHVFTTVRWHSADLLSFFHTLDFDRSGFINLEKEL